MINEIKTIIQNYLSNVKLCQLMVGTVADDGIKVSDRLTIPSELIKGNLKEFIAPGDRVRLIRNHGGQEFYIVEIIEKKAIFIGTVVSDGIDTGTETIPNELIIGNLKEFVVPGDKVRLIRNHGGRDFYIAEIVEKKSIFIGTVESGGINTGTETIPMNRVFGNRKSSLALGDNVRLLRNLGSNDYFILEVITE